MGSEVVLVDDIAFPKEIIPTGTSKPLLLVGHGITDIEIHFLQVKFTAIGVYVDKDLASHLQAWKGKTEAEIQAEVDSFFDDVVKAPVEKFIRVVQIKELKGSQYSLQLESTVRDRLVEVDKYEEEEEKELEKIVGFFQGKYLKKNSVISYHFPASTRTVEVGFVAEGKEESEAVKIKVENENVAVMIQRWYLGGSRAVSPSTIASLTNGISALLHH